VREKRLLESREFSPVQLIVGKLLRQVLEQFSGLVAILVSQGRYGEQEPRERKQVMTFLSGQL
jgi:hypothetical protein